MKIAYIRVSTQEQNEQRQVLMAQENGAERLFIDKASGKSIDRKQLKEMLDYVREGDTVICESISRIARNTADLLKIIDILNEKKVDFVSLKENLDTSTPTGKFLLSIFGAIAELERENILERQKQGIAIAKAQGKYKGRKPLEIDNAKFAEMVEEWRNGKRTAVSIQKHFGITSTTFYRWVNSPKYKNN